MKVRVGLALALALLAGCSSKKITGPNQKSNSSTNQQNATQVNQYLDSLPSWAQFSPLAQTDTVVTGKATTSDTTVARVTTFVDSAGDTTTATNVPYVCETTPYSITTTPAQIVMYDPNASVLYPGAFIQGKSYKDSIGSLLGLNIPQRAPIKVSIPDLKFADNYRTVDTVDEADVESAVGKIVDEATKDGVQPSTSMDFNWGSYYTEKQYALSMGLSGHYVGFSASVTGSINTDASEHTVAAYFIEKMFTVVVQQPSTAAGPAGWFSSDFTRADLNQLVNEGAIGPDNLPVYVGTIVYGRMMMFSLTSTASSDSIQFAINASYSGLGGGGSASMTAEEKQILRTATIHMATVGGSDSSAIAAIRTGDVNAYFSASPPLSTAAPLSYQFNNLVGGTTAQVSEATSYNVKTCQEAALPSAGQFDFQPEQAFAAPVPTPFETRLVDVNGDGRPDLVFNHLGTTSNQVAVALAQSDGTFAAPGAPMSAPTTPPGGWANYTLSTGDFNGDGKTDLAWTYPNGNTLRLDVALAEGSGGWNFEPPQEVDSGTWSNYHPYVADLNNNGCDDLIWNQRSNGPPSDPGNGYNYVAVALSKCDGTFALPDSAQLIGWGSWASTAPSWFLGWVVDYNKDGRADLVWNTATSVGTETMFNLSNGDGTFNSGGIANYTSGDWTGYHRLIADFTGDQAPDLLFYRDPETDSSQAYILSGLQTMLGPFSLTNVFSNGQSVTPVAGDVNDDGKADLILDHVTNSTNTIAVVFGTSTGLSVPANAMQTYPVSTNWTNATLPMVGDVNGDHNADVVWVIPGSPTQVFVALSKGNATGS